MTPTVGNIISRQQLKEAAYYFFPPSYLQKIYFGDIERWKKGEDWLLLENIENNNFVIKARGTGDVTLEDNLEEADFILKHLRRK